MVAADTVCLLLRAGSAALLELGPFQRIIARQPSLPFTTRPFSFYSTGSKLHVVEYNASCHAHAFVRGQSVEQTETLVIRST